MTGLLDTLQSPFGDVVFFADLSNSCQVCSGPSVRAIGWLSSHHPYVQGKVKQRHLTALNRHLASAYQPFLYRGMHTCELCRTREKARGFRNLLIPSSDHLYVAPELIGHYVSEHGYKPPDEFFEALLSCPDQQSVSYFELLKPFREILNGSTRVRDA